MTDQTPTEALQNPAGSRLSAPRALNGPAEPDAPDRHPARLTPEEIARHDETGWDTDGCDCGHDGMGPGWHARDCTWRGAYEYGRAVNAPLSPEAAEYIGRSLADRTAPRRKIKLPGDTITNQQWHDAAGAVDVAVRRDRFASAIYERANPGFRWADAHPDDRTAFGADGAAAAAVADLELARLAAERDRARDTAVELESQLAAVRDLHARDDSNPAGPWCDTCLTAWPCATARALDGEPAS